MIRHALPEVEALTALVIIIEACAKATAGPVPLRDHIGHEVFDTGRDIVFAHLFLSGAHDVIAKLKCGIVTNGKRTDRQAEVQRAILYERHRDTFSDHQSRFVNVRREDLVGEETTHIFHNDRCFLDPAVIIKRHG